MKERQSQGHKRSLTQNTYSVDAINRKGVELQPSQNSPKGQKGRCNIQASVARAYCKLFPVTGAETWQRCGSHTSSHHY